MISMKKCVQKLVKSFQEIIKKLATIPVQCWLITDNNEYQYRNDSLEVKYPDHLKLKINSNEPARLVDNLLLKLLVVVLKIRGKLILLPEAIRLRTTFLKPVIVVLNKPETSIIASTERRVATT